MKKITINGAECKTKEDLFNTFSTAFDFPDYFSGNWDSFDECMCDLSWIAENELEVTVENYSLMLADASDEDQDNFYGILSNVEEYSEKSFSVEFV